MNQKPSTQTKISPDNLSQPNRQQYSSCPS
uniref:Uncharacterized protein n=1 Tax=Arundo donax TaxID=35708 RepID=A0A0A8YGB7_ARUDO